MVSSNTPNVFDQYNGKPFTEWPRILQAIRIVMCLSDHDPTISNEFIQEEIDRLGLMDMTDEELLRFRDTHLLNHH